MSEGSSQRTGNLRSPSARALLAMLRAPASIAVPVVLGLTGCWTVPTASVQPEGEPRLIQDGIAVKALKSPAIVRSVDTTARRIVLSTPAGAAAVSYRVGPEVRTLDRIKVGDQVRATIAEELAVYVLRDGRLPRSGSGPDIIASNARVLSVEPSYRLLTLQLPNGDAQTFKVDRRVRLAEMAAGDDVVIRPVELLALQVRN